MEDEIKGISETSEQKIGKKRKIEMLVFIIVSVIAAAALAGSVVYYFQTKTVEQIKEDYERRLKTSEPQKQQQPVQAGPIEEPVETNSAESPEPNLQIGLNKIFVSWEEEPVEVEENCGGDRCFLVGKVTNDDPKYKGKDFYLEATSTMGGSDMKHYVFEKDADGADVKAYAEAENGEEGGAAIAGITDIPETLTFPGTKYQLQKNYWPNSFFVDVKAEKRLFTDKNLGDFFLTEDGCVVAELPDSTAIAYNIVIPFLKDESNVPDIVFTNGEKNKDEYEYTRATCGGTCTYFSEAKDLNPEANLTVAGKASNGDDIYRYKDPNNRDLKDLYNDPNTMAYYSDDYEDQEGSKYTYDEFIGLNPYLFWKDPLGRWISFLNVKFSSAAEMCKPAVYLYPEKKTDLELTLDVNGFLTHTDPPYGNGWKVNASPDGKITDSRSGELYDYLLWEGIGLNYPKQEEGWVVKKEDLDSLLDEKLGVLGLNEKEKNDFKEYWLARLDEKPFYKISFLSRGQFENLASVRFAPVSPKVFIRVMMTAEGLDSYESIPEQKLPAAPQRNGFTAVEWGGALLK